MAKLALYQKYRSATFDEVVGQEYIVRSIRNAVRENKVGHAYLFCGPRGTGKTTMARLLAKSVNCENPESAPCGHCDNCIAAINGTHPDIVEINAANETHVEDIRELIDRSTLAPMQGLHKVYIIDEVHQLSSAASSALLKTLEEPPENVIFILATTDPQKLLPTIISRCQRFDFTKVREDQIKNHLLDIAAKENIVMEDKAAEMIADLSDGGMRDALSIMDQCAAFTNDEITIEALDRIYGLATVQEKMELIFDIVQSDLASLLNRVRSYHNRGIDLIRFTDGMIEILKEAVIYQSTKNAELLKEINQEQAEQLSQSISSRKGMELCNAFLEMKARFKNSNDVSMIFEIVCLSLATQTTEVTETVTAPVVKTEKTVSFSEMQKKTEEKKEEKQEPVVVIEQKPAEQLSTDMILSLLVQCDKNSKTTDESAFGMLAVYSDLENRKYTSLLESTAIAASGKDCILLKTSQQSVVNRINDKQMNEDLYFFMKDTMQIDKMIYAITDEQFKEATQAFITARKNGQLPELFHVKRYEKEAVHVETPEEKILKIFGKENVQIIDE